MDGVFKTYTSLHRNLTQADLDFLIFVQRNKIATALCNPPIKKLETDFDTLISYRRRYKSRCWISQSFIIVFCGRSLAMVWQVLT